MDKPSKKTHDLFLKQLLSHADAASEFLTNALPDSVSVHLDLTRLKYTGTSYTSRELREWLSDLVLRIPFKESEEESEVIILIEHKSFKDRLTPFQLLSYVAAGYQQQLKNGDKLHLILPVVYYHGKQKWELPSFNTFFGNVPPSMHKYIPHFHAEMLSIHNLSADQILAVTHGMLRACFMVHKGMHERIFDLKEYARVLNTLYKENKENFFRPFIVYIFGIDFFAPEEYDIVNTHFEPDSKTEAMTLREHFIEEGIKKGRLEGKQEGRLEGSLQSRYEVAKKLLLRKLPLEEICELTDLDMEEVRRLVDE